MRPAEPHQPFLATINQEALEDIRMLTGLTIKVVVATPGDVNAALAEAFDALALKDELTDRVMRPLPSPRSSRKRTRVGG